MEFRLVRCCVVVATERRNRGQESQETSGCSNEPTYPHTSTDREIVIVSITL
jgi:hypothetical protein